MTHVSKQLDEALKSRISWLFRFQMLKDIWGELMTFLLFNMDEERGTFVIQGEGPCWSPTGGLPAPCRVKPPDVIRWTQCDGCCGSSSSFCLVYLFVCLVFVLLNVCFPYFIYFTLTLLLLWFIFLMNEKRLINKVSARKRNKETKHWNDLILNIKTNKCLICNFFFHV